jgi:signal transduction histidine kinase
MLNNKVIGAIEIFRDIKKEKAVDQAKTEFVSLASHQLRAPLSSIRWYSEMLLSGDAGKLNEKQQKYAEEISHGNLRIIELVNALLNISRLELGTLEVREEDVDVGEIIREVMHDVQSRAEKQGVRLSLKIPDALPHAAVDRKLTRILIENLVVNAVKYTRQKGSVEVAITEIKQGDTFEGHRAHTRSLSISIADTGIGIPESQKELIFTKLFRADNARVFDTNGTGLGLYLVKRAAEYCKAEVWFESAEGRGSTFFALLPFLRSKHLMPDHALLGSVLSK